MNREEHIRLFGDSRAKSFHITALEETCEAARQIARENKWDEDYANLIIFANGVSFLQGKLVLEGVNTGQLKANETIEKLTSELQKYMAMYSVMKYQAFLKTGDNEAIEMRMNALRNANEGLKWRIDLFRQDEEKLKAEVARLRSENEALQQKIRELTPADQKGEAPTPEEKPGAVARQGWVSRALRFWRPVRSSRG